MISCPGHKPHIGPDRGKTLDYRGWLKVGARKGNLVTPVLEASQ